MTDRDAFDPIEYQGVMRRLIYTLKRGIMYGKIAPPGYEKDVGFGRCERQNLKPDPIRKPLQELRIFLL